MAAISQKTAPYKVLSNLMHNSGGPKGGKLYRKGDVVLLTEATAAPLLKSRAVEPAPASVAK
jgi:hypothetical protein